MIFNLENKITWSEISPSLQAKFIQFSSILDGIELTIIQNKALISENKIQIETNSAALDELEKYLDKKLAELEAYISSIKITSTYTSDGGIASILANGFYGQVVKINPGGSTIFTHDNFERLRVVHNQADFDYLVANIKMISLADVFNTWYRFAHSDNWALAQLVTNSREHSFGTWQNKGYLNIWSYNASDQSISQNVNDAPVCGFINPVDFYSNYYLRIKYNTGDDDNTLIFVGFMTDSNGIEHTLSVIRGAHSDTICYWAFVYDAGNPTQHKIIDYTNVVGSQDGGTFYMSVKRIDSYFEFKTAPSNSNVDEETWTMRWQYPSSCPSDMTAEEYTNIGIMVTRINRIGFGVRSMCTSFYIDKQIYIFDDEDIYRLDTDEVYGFNSSTNSWYKKGKASDVLVPDTYLYCSITKHLFFYTSASKWYVIK